MQALECFALHGVEESTDRPEQIVADLVGAFSKLMR
jgi:hypothetical protein